MGAGGVLREGYSLTLDWLNGVLRPFNSNVIHRRECTCIGGQLQNQYWNYIEILFPTLKLQHPELVPGTLTIQNHLALVWMREYKFTVECENPVSMGKQFLPPENFFNLACRMGRFIAYFNWNVVCAGRGFEFGLRNGAISSIVQPTCGGCRMGIPSRWRKFIFWLAEWSHS